MLLFSCQLGGVQHDEVSTAASNKDYISPSLASEHRHVCELRLPGLYPCNAIFEERMSGVILTSAAGLNGALRLLELTFLCRQNRTN